jgi:hypothetical protein
MAGCLSFFVPDEPPDVVDMPDKDQECRNP